jgi:hypothetical protein
MLLWLAYSEMQRDVIKRLRPLINLSSAFRREEKMKKHSGKLIVGIVALLATVGIYVFTASTASAHEHREVGDYEITFGWQVEPAFAGVFNGPEIRIIDTTTDEPVVGAEETLTLTVSFGPESKVLTLEPAWGEPGNYVAALTPTRPGDYEFELTGTISVSTALSETVVNELFTSADGDFSTIEPAADHLFPDTESDPISLQRQIDDLLEEIEALKAAVEELQEAH